MHIIPLSSITIPPNRQRRVFREDKIRELANSIAKLGLMHAPVVRETGGDYELVVGERRLRAIGTLNQFVYNQTEFKRDSDDRIQVPVTFLHELDADARFEAELHENLLRENLTWEEETAAIAELHKRRAARDPEHTNTATAKELANAKGKDPEKPVPEERKTVARALLIDKFRDDPHVMGARNAKEAANIARAKLQAEFAEDLQAQIAAQPSEHTLIVGDCREWLATAEAGQFDLVISDPPYGMGADSFGSAGASHSYGDGEEQIIISMDIIAGGYRITKPQAHLYLFCDIDHFHALRAAATAIGWYAWRTPLIFVKSGGMGHNPIPNLAIRRQHEYILFAVKGDRLGLSLMSDVIQDPRVGRQSTPEHAAAKPVWVYEALIRHSCHAGSRILDPCCGTGTIFQAAKSTHTRATGVELDPGFAQLARAKL